MRFTLNLFLIAILAIVTGRPALAAEDFAILPAKARPSDDCVGNPITPLCAIMTQMACEVWRRPELCRSVGYTTKYVGGGFSGIAALAIYKVRIVDQRSLEMGDVPDWKGNIGGWVKSGVKYETWRSGDLAVRWESLRCEPDERCVTATRDDPSKVLGEGCVPSHCFGSNYDENFVLRKVGNHWQVIFDNFDPEDHGAYWRAFWKRK